MVIAQDWLVSVFPEAAAGGFTRLDGFVQFYTRVNALLRPDMTVMDYGAGRGWVFTGLRPDDHRLALRRLRGKVRRVIGVDVDPVVATNPDLDAWHVLGPDEAIPLPDASVDLVVSDYTFEHVEDPARVAAELTRVLRPGGWLCARTPNRWGLVALASRLVPNRLHAAVLARVFPERKAEDVFATRYRLNDLAAVRRHFPPERFLHASFVHSAEPYYLPRRRIVWRAAMLAEALLPAAFGANLFIFLQKRPVPAREAVRPSPGAITADGTVREEAA